MTAAEPTKGAYALPSKEDELVNNTHSDLTSEWEDINRRLQTVCNDQAETVRKLLDSTERALDLLEDERERHALTNQRVSRVEKHLGWLFFLWYLSVLVLGIAVVKT